MGWSIDDGYPAREAASSQFVDRAYSRDRGTDDEHAISHGFLFSRTRRRTNSQRLDDEGVSDLSPKRVSRDDGIEIFPDVADPPIADREAKHAFVAIWPPLRQPPRRNHGWRSSPHGVRPGNRGDLHRC